VPGPSEETASESPVIDEHDTKTESSPGNTDVADSPIQIPATESPAVSDKTHNTECASSDAPSLTIVEPESDNSSSKVETIEPSSQTEVAETNTTESSSSASVAGVVGDDQHENHKPENITSDENCHSTAEVENKLEEMNLTANDSLPEMEESGVSDVVTPCNY